MSDKTDSHQSSINSGGEKIRKRQRGWDVEETPNKIATTSTPLPQNISQSSYQNPVSVPQKLLELQSMLSKTQTSKMINKIYVGSINYDIKSQDLMKLFSAFGPVVNIEMGTEPSGKSKGYCFIEYKDPEAAQAAQAMNGFELAGRKIKVGRPTQSNMVPNTVHQFQVPSQSFQPTQVSEAQKLPQSNFILISNIKNDISTEEVIDLCSLCGAIKNNKKIHSQYKDPELFYDLLLEFNESSCSLLASQTLNNHVLAGENIVVQPIPLDKAISLMLKKVEASVLCSVLLESMITLEDTEDPNLKDEIQEEAVRYGDLVKIDIITDKILNQANVKITYKEPIHALKAQKALGGRMFAGRKIKATLI